MNRNFMLASPQGVNHWEILRQYKAGESIEKLARANGLTEEKVKNRLRAEGVELRAEDK